MKQEMIIDRINKTNKKNKNDKNSKNSENKKMKNPRNYLEFLIFLGLFAIETGQAKNLGVWGPLFPIVEQDIKEFIFERLGQMKQDGELKKIEGRFIKNVEKHILRPTSVSGLTTTENPNTFYYDPTYIVAKNIEDDKGRVIIKTGTTINPLDLVKLHVVLFFLDADDKRQIKWALGNSKKYDYVKYVLVKGNIKDAGERLSNRVYFDQTGAMTDNLRIRHVPCVVKQDGKKLQIKEVGSFELSKLEDGASNRSIGKIEKSKGQKPRKNADKVQIKNKQKTNKQS